jgi:hypothetical protein
MVDLSMMVSLMAKCAILVEDSLIRFESERIRWNEIMRRGVLLCAFFL